MSDLDTSQIDVLLVDRNHYFRSIIKAMLLRTGVRDISEASGNEQALSLLKSRRFDIAFVDCALPNMEGLELVREMRSTSDMPNQSLPVVLMTSDGRRSVVKSAINAGVETVLLKPISMDDVQRRLDHLITRPHTYVQAEEYAGPDRRRRNDPVYTGPERRG